MKIVLTALIIVLIVVITKHILYRRQIRSICRQLAFLNESVTNQRIRTDCTDKEILNLVEHITDMYEKQMQREHDLQVKDRRMKDTLTSVSHDIRTPLTSLKGYFELLMSEDDVSKQMEYASVMSERMDCLADLLEELFTYTKLQNEEYSLKIEEHDLTRLVLETLFSFYEEFKGKEIQAKLDVCDDSVIMLCNDVAMKRIFTNIIKNAVIHGNGSISLHYGKYPGSMELNDSNIVRFVCENRVDNPNDINLVQIFDRFYKADRSRSQNTTGLGLTIVKELVEMMGGRIWSELVGDRFKVTVEFTV